MPRNGSGTYNIPNTFLPNTTISSAAVNENYSDIATALTGSLPRNGEAGMTGQFIAIAGTASAPGVYFAGSTQSGFYRSASNQISIATAGVERVRFKADGSIRSTGDDYLWSQLGASSDMVSFLGAADDAAARTALGLGALATKAAVGTADIADDAVTQAKVADAAVGTAQLIDASVTPAKVSSGIVVQAVTTQLSAVGTTSAAIPFDDTIPQNTEGVELMTVTITPTSASSTLYIEAEVYATGNGTAQLTTAIFRDSGADAIGAGTRYAEGGVTGLSRATALVSAGSTSATTFKVRFGPVGVVTATINGVNGGRRLGGALISSLRVSEIKG